MSSASPYTPKSDFLRAMVDRGFFNQCTDLEGLDAAFLAGPVTGYIGFDATADSLHVGSLVQIMILRWMQKTGHRPIALMGGGTTKIGDPSGKDESRQLLTNDAIAQNIVGIRKPLDRLLDFNDGPNGAILANNADWLDELAYIPFLRDVGRHFTINRMLTFDSVKLRLDREQPLTFLEFNYMILQAYDFVELNRRYGCSLQCGGSDQWGNIVNGVELGRRVSQAALFGLTAPLLTTASGAKMGKTANGAVWLNPERLSDWDFWQYWRNTEDADVGRFLRLFTELPLDEIARLEALQGAEINEAKKILANAVTALMRGEEAGAAAAETARQTFEQGTTAEGLPTIDVGLAELEEGIPAYALLLRSGLAGSNGEARRLIKGGGAKVNDIRIADEQAKITTADITDGDIIKLSSGKKNHALVKVAR
ncbi:tyrosine--tRNA ligase [Nitrospirillum sp. BR 11828]|uniref:tyrosine--tRNA ligase n=1 Tax=Nitrospirillum sp. BR 11828 TaxID=3104325 RepID=UPI002ACA3CAD|nr:tyrosine--tRNA ligase [Nitrospirillum sp. BR 11828]MDZ5649037.1 tyrosine--tRNA ligase [Nitrospirillum sp. BR 11828]